MVAISFTALFFVLILLGVIFDFIPVAAVISWLGECFRNINFLSESVGASYTQRKKAKIFKPVVLCDTIRAYKRKFVGKEFYEMSVSYGSDYVGVTVYLTDENTFMVYIVDDMGESVIGECSTGTKAASFLVENFWHSKPMYVGAGMEKMCRSRLTRDEILDRLRKFDEELEDENIREELKPDLS